MGWSETPKVRLSHVLPELARRKARRCWTTEAARVHVSRADRPPRATSGAGGSHGRLDTPEHGGPRARSGTPGLPRRSAHAPIIRVLGTQKRRPCCHFRHGFGGGRFLKTGPRSGGRVHPSLCEPPALEGEPGTRAKAKPATASRDDGSLFTAA